MNTAGMPHASFRDRGRLAAIILFLAMGYVQAASAASPPALVAGTSLEPGQVRIEPFRDRYAVSAREVQLRKVLVELASHTNLTLILGEGLDETVSLELGPQSLERLVRRLLRGRSFVLQVPSTVGAGVEPSLASARLWVLAHGAMPQDVVLIEPGGNLARPPSEQAEAVYRWDIRRERRADLEQALLDPDRDVRAAAIDSLVELGDLAAAQLLVLGLSDNDAELREDTVYGLGDIGVAWPGFHHYLQQAMQDPAPAVRAAAAQVLAELDDVT